MPTFSTKTLRKQYNDHISILQNVHTDLATPIC